MSGYASDTVAGVAILLWQASPDDPLRLPTPLLHAAAAAAMDVPVELYFASKSVQLLRPGVADGLRATPQAPRSIGALLREAHGLGVRLYVCSEALAAQGLAGTALIPECSGHGGAVQFQSRAIDARWRALVF